MQVTKSLWDDIGHLSDVEKGKYLLKHPMELVKGLFTAGGASLGVGKAAEAGGFGSGPTAVFRWLARTGAGEALGLGKFLDWFFGC